MIDLEGNFPNNSLAGVLNTGLRVIDQNQSVEFVAYTRYTLPYDGYVFWVKDPNIAPIQVDGSLHYQTDQKQELDKTIGYHNVIFTTQTQVSDFDTLQPNQMWLGKYDAFEFGFSSHANRYEQAGLWHYIGQAVYPEMRTQIIESYSDLPDGPIVSNSLPLFIALNDYAQVYPSWLVPENLTPPYIVCDINPEDTEQLQPIAHVNSLGTWQLCKDKVRLIIYGMTNQDVQNYLQYLLNSSLDDSKGFGILKMGAVVRDGKHIQSEMNVLAEQKFVELEVSYNQQAVYNTALQYIIKVLPIPVEPINP